MKKYFIDEEEVKRLYMEEKLPAYEIAARFKVPDYTISYIVWKHQLKRDVKRPNRGRKKIEKPDKPAGKCGTCAFSGKVGITRICDYICITGHMRNSDPNNCDKYIRRKRGRAKNAKAEPDL